MENQGNEIIRFQKKICRLALIFSVIVAVVFLFFDQKAIAKGLVLGTIFSVINFIILGRSLPKVVGRSRKGATLAGLAGIMSRYILLAVPMIIAVKSPSFDFIAVVIGIFSVQITTLVDHFLTRPAVEGK